MTLLSSDQMKAKIKDLVKQGLERVSPEELEWVKLRLIEPRLVTLSLDPEGKKPAQFWLVTDHLGESYGYRIAYNPSDNKFGLVDTLSNDVEWYMGNYGTFEKTLMMM